MTFSTYQQKLRVDFSFPVMFTRDVFDPGNRCLRSVMKAPTSGGVSRCVVVVEEAVANAHPGLCKAAEEYLRGVDGVSMLAATIRVERGGEEVKGGWKAMQSLAEWMISARLCRHSYVLVVGGGALLDAVGCAAALVHRGMRVIRLPTTVLGQNDAGVGVKTAINLASGKNIIGTFSPPHAVINDSLFLQTLPWEGWRDGIAEAIKVAMIKDAGFFREVSRDMGRYRERSLEAMERLVRRCAELHLDHIREGGDPFETGSSRPLDFGHWSAHQLELLSGYTMSHGEAVGLGIRIDTNYATQMGWLSGWEAAEVQNVLTAAGFPLWCEALSLRDERGQRRVLEGLERFREHLGGTLTLVFPAGLGAMREEREISLEVLNEMLDEMDPHA
ncbi:MAG TPA: 3-dehydroquinate synthase [Kiritimatiellia bacterium]|nr:3-dehydroquinate synthase [Kiritimatiellia bacterium]